MNRNEKNGRLHIAVIREKTKTAPQAIAPY